MGKPSAAEWEQLDRRARELHEGGDTPGAIALWQEAHSQALADLGPDALPVGNLAHELGDASLGLVRFADACRWYEEAYRIRSAHLPEDDLDLATTLLNWGWALCHRGSSEQGREYVERAIAIRERGLGSGHPLVGEGYFRLGAVHITSGRDRQAVEPLQRAIDIIGKSAGGTHPVYAKALSNLAMCYVELQEYEQALRTYEQAIECFEQTGRAEHSDMGRTLNNLSGLYITVGATGPALRAIERSIEIKRSALGDDNPDLGSSYSNLAILLAESGDLPRARRASEEAIQRLRRAYPEGHRQLADAFANYGVDLAELGLLDEAEQAHREALEMHRQLIGEQSVPVAHSLRNLGDLYLLRTDGPAAGEVLTRAVDIYTAHLGRTHPFTALCLASLAKARHASGGDAAAHTLALEALETLIRHQEAAFGVLDSRGKVEAKRWAGKALAVALSTTPPDEDARRLLGSWLTHKGVVGAFETVILAARHHGDERVRGLVADYLAVRKELAGVSLAEEPADERLSAVRSLTAELAGLEVRLSRELPAFDTAIAPGNLTVEDLEGVLAEGEALLDYLEVEGDAHAALVSPGSEPLVCKLGSSKEIARLAAALREAIRDATGLKDTQGAAELLRTALLGQFQDSLSPVRRLFFSPDGALAGLPLEAAMGAAYLAPEGPEVCYTPSARELVRLRRRATDGPPLAPGAAFADPHPAGTASPATTRSLAALLEERGAAPLPASQREALQAARLLDLPPDRVFIGEQASAENLFALTSPAFLHLAVHAAYDSGPSVLTPHPAMRSALVLAGRDASSPREIVPASNLATLDLRATRLVVFSACESAATVATASEAAPNLTTAALAAGARGVISALWAVPDEATADLMGILYRHLAAGASPSAALRAAKIEMARTHAPAVWASLIFTGAPVPLVDSPAS